MYNAKKYKVYNDVFHSFKKEVNVRKKQSDSI